MSGSRAACCSQHLLPPRPGAPTRLLGFASCVAGSLTHYFSRSWVDNAKIPVSRRRGYQAAVPVEARAVIPNKQGESLPWRQCDVQNWRELEGSGQYLYVKGFKPSQHGQ